MLGRREEIKGLRERLSLYPVVGIHTTAPGFTKSMTIAAKDLRLESLDVIHAGEATYPLTDKIRAVSIERVTKDVSPLS